MAKKNVSYWTLYFMCYFGQIKLAQRTHVVLYDTWFDKYRGRTNWTQRAAFCFAQIGRKKPLFILRKLDAKKRFSTKIMPIEKPVKL